MENLGSFVQRAVERNGPRPALSYGPGKPTEVWTYAELWERSSGVARWLQDQGLAKGDRVIIWAPNSPWWVAAFLAALRTGVILVPLDLRCTPDFVQRVVEQTEPRLALLSAATRAGWPHPVPAFLVEDLGGLSAAAGAPGAAAVGPDDPAVIIFTSGTTGNPKGVILTHGNILFSAGATDRHVPNIPEVRTVSILPLCHIFEENVGLIMALQRDASIYYLNTLSPAAIFGALAEHGPTTLLLVPQVLQLFMSTIEREAERQGQGANLARLRRVAPFLPGPLRRRLFRPVLQRLGGRLVYMVSAGAQIQPALIRKWEVMGVPIIQGYGATECTAAVSTTTLRDHNPHSVGTAIPGVEVQIAEDGEILVRGPNIFPGYWRNPTASAEALVDGWYHTGDLGRLDARGHLYFLSRKKDMIALPNGQKVYAVDVEDALKAVPGVADAAVVGLPGDDGLQVHAALILDPEAPAPDAILKAANAHLAPHQFVRSYTLWPDKEFPTTYTMKVKKHEVLARVVALRAAPEPAAVAAGAKGGGRR